ncbi:hypothetical protein [Streptomyces sp. NPDC058674]|uniref:hypothetical protein n=1 Tax=Streptomyces sp. NPDC058674 TaxID=3346592 RepID=UPI003649E536
MKLARFATATALAAALAGAAVAPAAAQQTTTTHPYSCSNVGSGAGHTVNCSGLITVNTVLNGTTVNTGDLNGLNGTQINDLQVTLASVADNNVNAPVAVDRSRRGRTGAGRGARSVPLCTKTSRLPELRDGEGTEPWRCGPASS